MQNLRWLVCIVVVAGAQVITAEVGTTLADFDTAESVERCTYVLFNLVTPRGEITCDELFDWARCFVRVQKLDQKEATADDVDAFNGASKGIIDTLMLDCIADLYYTIKYEKEQGQQGYTPSPDRGSTATSEQSYTPTPSQGNTATSETPYTPTPEPGYTPTPEPGDTPTPDQGYTPTPEPGYAPTPVPGYASTPEPGYTQTPQPGYTATEKPYLPSGTTPYIKDADCLIYNDDACNGRPNGDYSICPPVCQRGVYVTCSNGRIEIRECPAGWFKDPTVTSSYDGRFTARLVYDPVTRYCLQASQDCPRDLDNSIESRK